MTASHTSHDLLTATFEPIDGNTCLHPNVIAMARVYQAIGVGNLSVNGLQPDANYSLADYLIYGGRIRFDLQALSADEKEDFWNYIFNQNLDASSSILYHRRYATHRAAGVDASGNLAEIKSLVLGSLIDTFTPLNKSLHWGIDLPIGGKNAKADGEWGHMYIGKSDAMVMVGIEPSAYGKKNKRTQEVHSVLGLSGKLSPFMQPKINSSALAKQQISMGKCPLSTKGKYNWACVKITPLALQSLLTNKLTLTLDQERQEFKTMLTQPHPNSITVQNSESRFRYMQAWQKATNTLNAKNKRAIWGGVILAVIGLVIAVTPIPVVSQALGGLILAIGIKSALVGVGVTAITSGALGFLIGKLIGHIKAHLAEKKLQKLKEHELAQVQPLALDQAIHVNLKSSISSPARIASSLHIDVNKTSNANLHIAPTTKSLTRNKRHSHDYGLGSFNQRSHRRIHSDSDLSSNISSKRSYSYSSSSS
jgi:hypothetical protein